MATQYLKRIVPLFDRVLVQRVKPKLQIGGILLPEAVAQKTNEAMVIAVGKGARNMDGKFTPPSVAPGDTILLADYRGDEVKLNNDSFILIREEDILAKLEDTDARPAVKSGGSDLPDIRDLPKS